MEKVDHCVACSGKEFEFLLSSKAQMSDSNEEFHFYKCKSCNLVILNPRLSIKDLSQYYTSSYLPYRGSSAWGKYAPFVDNSQNKLDHIRYIKSKKYHQISAASVIMDIGCGNPTFIDYVQKRTSCKAIGIDFSDNGWQEDPSKFPNLELKTMDVQELKPAEKIDIITMWHYLEHDYFPDRTLAKLREIVKPNSKLIIEVPNYDSISRRIYGKNWAGFHTPRHTYLFSPENLTKLLHNTGWSVEEIDKKGTLDYYNLYWMSEMERKNINWESSMEDKFWPYVFGMIKNKAKNILSSHNSHGIMTVTASPN